MDNKMVGKNIGLVREKLNMGKTEFCGKCGITEEELEKAEGGEPIDGEIVHKICDKCSVNKKWLTKGELPIFNESPFADELIEIFDKLDTASQQQLVKVARCFEDNKQD